MSSAISSDIKIAARNQLTEALTMLFDSGQNSDFTVQCGDRVWKLHRVILSAGSDYFKKACSENFEEGLRNSIELKEDDPQHAEWMLRFLYAHDYYVDYCDGKPPIVAHARMYAIADKYDIPILKDLAIAKFAPSLKDTQAVDIPSFTAAIEVIYTSTLDTDRGLRDCLIPTLKDRMRHLRDDEHSMKLVKSLGEGDFAVDVIDAWTVLKELVLKGSITWYCKCGNLGTGTLSTCTECGSKQLRHGFS